MINMRCLKEIIGKVVSSVDKGHGSFFNIYFNNFGVPSLRLWIYDTRWALTVNGIELVSSDDVDEDNFSDVRNALVGRSLTEVEILDDKEFHLEFDSSVVIELWVDEIDDGSLGAALVYEHDSIISKLSYPLEDGV